MTLEQSPFYLLESSQSERCLCSHSRYSLIVKEEIYCKSVPGHERVRRLLMDPSFDIPCSPPDDILFAWTSECLVRTEMLSIMEQAGLTGFWTKPAKAFTSRKKTPVLVHELRINGWGGVISPLSGVTRDYVCSECKLTNWSNLKDDSQLIDVAQWDGSDFFIIWPLSGSYFVTSKVVEVFAQYSIKGARFLKSFPRSTHRMGYSPRSIVDVLPEEQARLIQKEFGLL